MDEKMPLKEYDLITIGDKDESGHSTAVHHRIKAHDAREAIGLFHIDHKLWVTGISEVTGK